MVENIDLDTLPDVTAPPVGADNTQTVVDHAKGDCLFIPFSWVPRNVTYGQFHIDNDGVLTVAQTVSDDGGSNVADQPDDVKPFNFREWL